LRGIVNRGWFCRFLEDGALYARSYLLDFLCIPEVVILIHTRERGYSIARTEGTIKVISNERYLKKPTYLGRVLTI